MEFEKEEQIDLDDLNSFFTETISKNLFEPPAPIKVQINSIFIFNLIEKKR